MRRLPLDQRFGKSGLAFRLALDVGSAFLTGQGMVRFPMIISVKFGRCPGMICFLVRAWIDAFLSHHSYESLRLIWLG